MTAKNSTKKVKPTGNRTVDLVPPEYRAPGLGTWSSNPNGYSHFLEIAIKHFKEAATRSVENKLEVEYKIFNERVKELQKQLEQHNAEQEKTISK